MKNYSNFIEAAFKSAVNLKYTGRDLRIHVQLPHKTLPVVMFEESRKNDSEMNISTGRGYVDVILTLRIRSGWDR
jgi:hypothetical protein